MMNDEFAKQILKSAPPQYFHKNLIANELVMTK
jgi:hypothetical protein